MRYDYNILSFLDPSQAMRNHRLNQSPEQQFAYYRRNLAEWQSNREHYALEPFNPLHQDLLVQQLNDEASAYAVVAERDFQERQNGIAPMQLREGTTLYEIYKHYTKVEEHIKNLHFHRDNINQCLAAIETSYHTMDQELGNRATVTLYSIFFDYGVDFSAQAVSSFAQEVSREPVIYSQSMEGLASQLHWQWQKFVQVFTILSQECNLPPHLITLRTGFLSIARCFGGAENLELAAVEAASTPHFPGFQGGTQAEIPAGVRAGPQAEGQTSTRFDEIKQPNQGQASASLDDASQAVCIQDDQKGDLMEVDTEIVPLAETSAPVSAPAPSPCHSGPEVNMANVDDGQNHRVDPANVMDTSSYDATKISFDTTKLNAQSAGLSPEELKLQQDGQSGRLKFDNATMEMDTSTDDASTLVFDSRAADPRSPGMSVEELRMQHYLRMGVAASANAPKAPIAASKPVAQESTTKAPTAAFQPVEPAKTPGVSARKVETARKANLEHSKTEIASNQPIGQPVTPSKRVSLFNASNSSASSSGGSTPVSTSSPSSLETFTPASSTSAPFPARATTSPSPTKAIDLGASPSSGRFEAAPSGQAANVSGSDLNSSPSPLTTVSSSLKAALPLLQNETSGQSIPPVGAASLGQATKSTAPVPSAPMTAPPLPQGQTSGGSIPAAVAATAAQDHTSTTSAPPARMTTLPLLQSQTSGGFIPSAGAATSAQATTSKMSVSSAPQTAPQLLQNQTSDGFTPSPAVAATLAQPQTSTASTANNNPAKPGSTVARSVLDDLANHVFRDPNDIFQDRWQASSESAFVYKGTWFPLDESAFDLSKMMSALTENLTIPDQKDDDEDDMEDELGSDDELDDDDPGENDEFWDSATISFIRRRFVHIAPGATGPARPSRHVVEKSHIQRRNQTKRCAYTTHSPAAEYVDRPWMSRREMKNLRARLRLNRREHPKSLPKKVTRRTVIKLHFRWIESRQLCVLKQFYLYNDKLLAATEREVCTLIQEITCRGEGWTKPQVLLDTLDQVLNNCYHENLLTVAVTEAQASRWRAIVQPLIDNLCDVETLFIPDYKEVWFKDLAESLTVVKQDTKLIKERIDRFSADPGIIPSSPADHFISLWIRKLDEDGPIVTLPHDTMVAIIHRRLTNNILRSLNNVLKIFLSDVGGTYLRSDGSETFLPRLVEKAPEFFKKIMVLHDFLSDYTHGLKLSSTKRRFLARLKRVNILAAAIFEELEQGDKKKRDEKHKNYLEAVERSRKALASSGISTEDSVLQGFNRLRLQDRSSHGEDRKHWDSFLPPVPKYEPPKHWHALRRRR